MSCFVLVIATGVFALGGGIFTILFADIIVALAIIWYVFFKRKHKKD
jgi:Flp pilus assembly protein TadB